MSVNQNASRFCLFCYKTTSLSEQADKNVENISKFVKIVNRLIKSQEVDILCKVFITKKLVECCNKCNDIIEYICKIYTQLKILELKLDFKLDQLVEKINYANKVPTRWIHVNKVLEEIFLNDAHRKAEGQQKIRKFRQSIIEAGNQSKLQTQPRVLLRQTENIPKLINPSNLNANIETTNYDETEYRETGSTSCPKSYKSKTCPKCGKTLLTFKGLKHHLESHKDKSEWQYKCHMCTKSFTHPTNLSSHLRSHTGERPFTCRFCKMGFRYRSNFTRHLKSVHANEKGLEKELKRKWSNKPVDDTPNFPKDTDSLISIENHGDNHEYEEMPDLDDYSENVTPQDLDIDLDENYLPETENMVKGQVNFSNDDLVVDNMETIVEEESASFEDPQIQVKIEHPLIFQGQPEKVQTHQSPNRIRLPRLNDKSTKKLYDCKTCGQKVKSRNALKIHLKTHIKSKWKCITCGKKFPTNFGLQSHLRAHKRKKQLQCIYCGNKYWYKLSLCNHLTEKHGDEEGIKEEIRNNFGNLLNAKDRKSITTTSQSQMESLIRDKKFSICRDCKKPFPTLQKLRAHMNSMLCAKKVNLNGDVFKCETCGMVFIEDKQLWKHLREVHEERVCLDCGKQFKKTFNFKVHLEYHKDPKEWKFECDICGKKCVTSCKLKEHKGYHLNKNYRRRNLGGKGEGFGSDLKSSRVVRQRKPRYLKFTQSQNRENSKCRECGEVFRLNKELWLHLREVHEEKVCLKCGKRFTFSYNLKLHLECHKDPSEWEFGCTICGNRFVTSTKLKRHLKIHERNKIIGVGVNVKKLAGNGKGMTDSNSNRKKALVTAEKPRQSRYGLRANRKTNFELVDDNDSDDYEDMNIIETANDEKGQNDTGPILMETESIKGKIGSFNELNKNVDERNISGNISSHNLQINGKGEKCSKSSRWRCKTCGRSFVAKMGLKAHMRVHSSRKFDCKFCGQVYSYKLRLHNHLKEKHGDEKEKEKVERGKSYKVLIPKKKFIPIKNSHQSKISVTDGKSAYCRDCKKPFQNLRLLKAHLNRNLCTMTINEADEAIQCEVCERMFDLDKDLWMHQRDIHSKFVCSQCGKQFTRYEKLSLHLEYHKDPKEWKFKCEICGRKCVCQWKLNQHMKLHSRKNYTIRRNRVGGNGRDNCKLHADIVLAIDKPILINNHPNSYNKEDDLGQKMNEIGEQVQNATASNILDENNILGAKGDCFGDGTLVEFEDLD